MPAIKSLNALEETPIKKNRGWVKHIAGGLISIICLAIIAANIDLHKLTVILAEFHWTFLLYGLLALVIDYFFRIIRWTFMLRAARASVKFSVCLAPFLGSMALNNILPLRLGDVVRAFVFPGAIGVDKTIAASSLVMERLIDLLTVFSCLIIGLAMTESTALPDWLAKSVLPIVFIAGACLLLVFLCSGRLARFFASLVTVDSDHSAKNKLFRFISDLLRGFEAMSRLRILIILFAISLIVWICESGLYMSLLAGFHLKTNLPLAMTVMSIVTFSTLIPSSPGFIGPFHLAAFTAISWLGGTSDEAAGFAVLAHLSLWVPTTLAGVIAIVLTPDLFKAVVNKSDFKN